MSDDALTMRVPAHGTKDARKMATRARGLQAIVRGFAESGASVFLSIATTSSSKWWRICAGRASACTSRWPM
jgi:hypothetical protein